MVSSCQSYQATSSRRWHCAQLQVQSWADAVHSAQTLTKPHYDRTTSLLPLFHVWVVYPHLLHRDWMMITRLIFKVFASWYLRQVRCIFLAALECLWEVKRENQKSEGETECVVVLHEFEDSQNCCFSFDYVQCLQQQKFRTPHNVDDHCWET